MEQAAPDKMKVAELRAALQVTKPLAYYISFPTKPLTNISFPTKPLTCDISLKAPSVGRLLLVAYAFI